MINNKEKKMIQRYCIYPKIAVVALIFSFVQCALIDDLVFQNKGFQPTGMFTALGFVIIYVIIFCFCALAPKFGMNGKKWKSLIGRLNVKQSETDYSKEVSAALASQAVGRFLKESDNDTAKNIGSAMQVAGAVSTVSTSIDMLSEAGSNAENMAHAYRIPIPDIKKQLIAFAVIPILIRYLYTSIYKRKAGNGSKNCSFCKTSRNSKKGIRTCMCKSTCRQSK